MSFWIALQNMQKNFRKFVTDMHFLRCVQSPTQPKISPKMHLENDGKLAKTPVFEILKPKTFCGSERIKYNMSSIIHKYIYFIHVLRSSIVQKSISPHTAEMED